MTQFEINWDEKIPFPAYAENNKFIPLSGDDGNRKYALLTYTINATGGGGGGGGSVTGIVSSIEIGSNSFVVFSSSIPAGEPYVVYPDEVLRELEIQNRTSESIYYLPTATTDVDYLSSKGIILFSDGSYLAKRTIHEFTIVAESSGIVTVLGYF